MGFLVLAVNPALATLGQLAAIIIGLFALIFVLLAVVFNLVMAFGANFLQQKVNAIKLLRPTVDSLNKTTELMESGGSPSDNTNKLVRTIAEGPVQVHHLDKKVDELSDRAAEAVVEVHARAEQVKTIAKALFLPGLHTKPRLVPAPAAPTTKADDKGLEFNSPGYRMLMEEKAPEYPLVPSTDSNSPNPVPGITASDLKNAPTR